MEGDYGTIEGRLSELRFDAPWLPLKIYEEPRQSNKIRRRYHDLLANQVQLNFVHLPGGIQAKSFAILLVEIFHPKRTANLDTIADLPLNCPKCQKRKFRRPKFWFG